MMGTKAFYRSTKRRASQAARALEEESISHSGAASPN